MNMLQLTLESRHQLGSQIKELRKTQRLTQKQLGLMIGRDRSYISRIEHGRCSATFDTLLLIACGLDITLSELLDGIGVPAYRQEEPPPIMLSVPRRKSASYYYSKI